MSPEEELDEEEEEDLDLLLDDAELLLLGFDGLELWLLPLLLCLGLWLPLLELWDLWPLELLGFFGSAELALCSCSPNVTFLGLFVAAAEPGVMGF